ncbi:AAA family ATPase [Streptomyces sp. NPDC087420]|uniref:helix-turn-helix transcriptional regulator n=1 Tax=Streptomyces sp. NPDC087420 TaxID=3365785 RepID=UPI003836326B
MTGYVPVGTRGRQVPLTGRQEERRLLADLLNGVREGQSGSLVLVGEPGIGKTRLLDHAAESCADLRVVRIAGVESETRLGFAALHRLLRPCLPRLDSLSAPQREALGSAFGVVAGVPADRYLVGMAALTLLSEASTVQPLLCVVDDVQWLDRESAEALAFAARRLHADAIGMVFAGREGPDGAGPFDGLPTVTVAGLPEGDARRLLSATGAGRLDAAVAGRIVAGTGGNPLALIELAGTLAPEQLAGTAPLPAPLPVGRLLESHFLRQVRTLPAETQSLLLILSATPPEDPFLLWRAAGHLGVSAGAADPAMSAGILTRDHVIGFRHPLIRSAVYLGAEAADRRRIHAGLAAVSDPLRDPDRRAWHRAQSVIGLDEQVALELDGASEQARRRGGFSTQAAFLMRAAELTSGAEARAVRLLAAASANITAGDPALARTLLERTAPDLRDPRSRAQAQRLRGTIELLHQRMATVPEILLGAVAELGGLDPQLGWDMLSEGLQAAIMAGGYVTGTSVTEVARAVVGASRRPEVDVTAAGRLTAALATHVAEDFGRAAPLLREALTDLCAAGELPQTNSPQAAMIAIAADALWDDGRRYQLLYRLSQADRDHGALYSLSITLVALATSELWAGRFTEAEARHDEVDDLIEAMGRKAGTPLRRAELLAWQGREAEARAAAALQLRFAGQLGLGVLADQATRALTLLELGLGRYQEALDAALGAAPGPVRGVGADPGSGGHLMLPNIVEAAIRAGAPGTAAEAYGRLEERATTSGTPWALGLLARCGALLGGDERAEEQYRESVELLGRTRMLTDLARTHLLFGEWLRRRKRRADARVHLRTAYEMFTGMGAAAFAERTRVELLATGERARRRNERTDHDLTPQERHVAGLAAAGTTNSEIAGRLFITTSTVEYHLNKVFRKLDITSRRQLASVLDAEA